MALKPLFPVPFHIHFLFAPFMVFVLLFGCATNPATKKREFMLVSEEEEFNIGKGVDKTVREEMGIYRELPELRAYVQNMGRLIGKNSDRPDLIYRIEIVDTPDFNAFAVPGGFVYVHRGLLEKMNSADELASVIGHELAHVAARHSASQISKSQLLNYGLLALDVLSGGGLQDYGQLVGLGSVLAFNRFSRDDEREADHFGTRYMAAAGYNPKASVDMMKQLEKLHEKEPSDFEVWFMTHPATSERIENLRYEVEWFRQNQPEALKRPIKRNEFIALLDGMPIGECNEDELIKDQHYYNKEYNLSIPMPDEWVAVINHKTYTAIFAHPKEYFFVYFTAEPLQKRLTTAAYFEEFEKQMTQIGLKKTEAY
ncbi:MAG: M48 family metallopeptidase, partial [Thermodesulfobacteriota bacterium]|nr:M48 family metallopeptidase [Thermodesulfobacteriota bacterium]